MQWVFYLLAQHPEAQERAAAEIAQGVGWQTGAGLMKGAVKEALRLYPVATFLTRIIPQESVIGGYSIPAEVNFMLIYFIIFQRFVSRIFNISSYFFQILFEHIKLFLSLICRH